MAQDNLVILYSSKCLEYEIPGHPESPLRLSFSYEFLKKKGFKFRKPSVCREKDILTVHSRLLLDKVKNRNFFEPDTPALKDIYDYACLSAGSGIEAASLALKGIKAFSLMRPPGHHASGDILGGFCYFNNIAIAVNKALDSIDRVAILDIDVHHGNGTQDIFLGNQKVLYVSLHQSPMYPGTGFESIKNCLNFPLPTGTDEGRYIDVLTNALERIRDFSPQLLAISAGFDTYKLDPLAGFCLELDTFGKIGQLISGLRISSFCVLEGGYSRDLPECIYRFLLGWAK